MQRKKQTSAFVVAILLVLSLAATPVQAASDDGYFDAMVEDDGDNGFLDIDLRGFAKKAAEVSGWLAKQGAKYSPFSNSSQGTASAYAADVDKELESNNATIEDAVNRQLNASTNYDTFRVYYHDQNGGNVTRYVVANVSDGNYTNIRQLNQTEFDALNRSVDHWVSLDWFASRNAADELSWFVEKRAEPGKALTNGDRIRLLGKYGGSVKSDLWGHESPSFNETDGGDTA